MAEPIKYDDIKCQRFNEWLDEQGEIPIAGVSFLPSRILFEMDVVAYEEAWSEYQEQAYEDLKDTIYNQYPSCIAYNFRLSEKGEGASDPVRKLLHLKDTWESIVFVLHALVWGEIRHKSIDLKAVQVFVSFGPTGDPVYGNFNTPRLISDALKTKTQNIKAVIKHAQDDGLGLKCEAISITVLDKLLELQDIRNDISHHTAPTREEAEAELMTVVPLFKEMLVLTEFLASCKILRFDSYAAKCKCEEFNGHALNKEFDEFIFVAPHLGYVLALGQENIFVKWDDELFSLSPFLHFEKDGVGRETYLSLYKSKKHGRYWFEPVTKRDEVSYDPLQPRFDAEQTAITNLIVP